jgi:VanZ family protein
MWYWLPVLMYLTLIVTLSAQPSLKPPPQFDLTDKLYHVLEYFGLGVLLARAFRAGRRAAPPTQTVTMVLALGVMVGAADEIFQSFVPGRMSDIFDLLADATGVLLAQLVFLLVVRE